MILNLIKFQIKFHKNYIQKVLINLLYLVQYITNYIQIGE